MQRINTAFTQEPHETGQRDASWPGLLYGANLSLRNTRTKSNEAFQSYTVFRDRAVEQTH